MKPDILLPYPAEEGLAPGGAGTYAVVYVRPETNTVLYERAILAAIRRRGDEVIHLANLNGGLFLRDRILEDHYATQLRFARDPRRELERWPPVADLLEHRFGASLERLELAGAFEALTRLGLSEEELFESIVPEPEMLAAYGQQFKRVGGLVVANPSLPAVLKRYTPAANVFVVVVRSQDHPLDFHASLNSAIHAEITSRTETPLVDGERLGSVPWPERIRRTYHISRSHFMAMLDMSDFVYLSESERLEVTRTPLGKSLLAEGIITEPALRSLKRDPLAYLHRGGRRTLEYLPLAGEGRSLEWLKDLLRGVSEAS